MDEITATPLCWPPHQARTPHQKRDYGRFGRREGYTKKLTLAVARDRLFAQLGFYQKTRRIKGQVIISSDLKLRNDGLPRSNQVTPSDPGIAVYFELDGKNRVLACDSYTKIEQNLAAIAATVQALRTIERHGSQLFEMAFTGFTALPGPDHVVSRSWRDVIDYYGENFDDAHEAYKRARGKAHPDGGGSSEAWNELQSAWEECKRELLGPSGKIGDHE